MLTPLSAAATQPELHSQIDTSALTWAAAVAKNTAMFADVDLGMELRLLQPLTGG